jgi:glyoxylate/hydroxypyruvate reductase
MSIGRATSTEPMQPRVLFSAPEDHWPLWRPHLLAAFAAEGLDVALTDDPAGPWTFDYLIYRPGGPVTDFTPFSRLKAVLSLWAGVEDIAGDPTLGVPLCRMVDAGLARGMAEWVAGHVLRYHLGTDAHVLGQDGVWRNGVVPPLAPERTVGLLGLGELGLAVAATLAGLGFDLRGWSRRPRELVGIATASGPEGLDAVLREAEILVVLLPATPETANILDRRTLALLPEGARIINPGRGALIDDAALLAALDAGRVGHATLDVFREEPLPPDHPFWTHPRVTVTPHVASETRPETASEAIARNIRRGEDGLPFLHVVDRLAGY